MTSNLRRLRGRPNRRRFASSRLEVLAVRWLFGFVCAGLHLCRTKQLATLRRNEELEYITALRCHVSGPGLQETPEKGNGRVCSFCDRDSCNLGPFQTREATNPRARGRGGASSQR